MLRYFISKEFWLIMLGLVLLGGLAFVLLFYVFLPSYTRQNETVVVPEVVKLTFDEANTALDERNLEAVVADSIYIGNLPPRAVVSQDPAPLSKVKPDRKIYLTLNKVVPPKVKVPNIFTGSSLYQAKLTLEAWNLSVGKVEYKPHPYKNVVLDAFLMQPGKPKAIQLKAGMEVPVESKIFLLVGQGKGSTKIEVPDLVGMYYTDAISQIHELGLNMGSIDFNPAAEDSTGKVIQQNPRYYPGDSLRAGDNIDLIIAGEQPEQFEEGIYYNTYEDEEEVPEEN